jgi:hypothetical protein
METITVKAHQIIARMNDAIRLKDEDKILKTYEKAETLNWESAPKYLTEEYNRLIDKANEILTINLSTLKAK